MVAQLVHPGTTTIESERQLQNTAAKQFPHSEIPLTPTLSRGERECRIQVVPLTERLIIAECLGDGPPLPLGGLG